MSKISEDDWYLTPGDTNLNESAHPFTNVHTGINLSLLEAISQARILDCDILETLRLSEENCILINNRNTKPERDHNNRKRAERRAQATTSRQEVVSEINGIQHVIRELQTQKQVIQETHGIRRSPLKPNARGKARIPNSSDVVPLEFDNEAAAPSSSQEQLDAINSEANLSTPPLHEDPTEVLTLEPTPATSHLNNVAVNVNELSISFAPPPTIPLIRQPPREVHTADQQQPPHREAVPVVMSSQSAVFLPTQGHNDFNPQAVDIQNIVLLQKLRRKDLNELCFHYRIPASGKNSDIIAHLQSLIK